jgi:hypothetical protein
LEKERFVAGEQDSQLKRRSGTNGTLVGKFAHNLPLSIKSSARLNIWTLSTARMHQFAVPIKLIVFERAIDAIDIMLLIYESACFGSIV